MYYKEAAGRFFDALIQNSTSSKFKQFFYRSRSTVLVTLLIASANDDEKYSLENLGDTFYVSNGNQFTGNGQLIEFDPKAKIPKHAVADYTYGNERGVLPLKETVEVD